VSLDHHPLEGGRPLEIAAPPTGDADPFLQARIRAAIDGLPTRERHIVVLLRSGVATREIAARLGVSEGRISQLKKGAIQRMRFSLGVVLGDARMTRA
jgi:DNA-directed RNA polymerase specialized sigma subunit